MLAFFIYLPILEKSGQFLATIRATAQIEIFHIFFDINWLDEENFCSPTCYR